MPFLPYVDERRTPVRTAVRGALPCTAILIALSTAGAVIADSGARSKTVTLSRKFAATQVNYYQLDREESSRQVVSLIPIPISMRRVMSDAWIERVRARNTDGTTTVDWTLDRAQYQRISEKNSFKFDTVSDEPNQESRPIQAMLNRPLAVRQKPTGIARPVHNAPPLPPPTTQAATKPPDPAQFMGPPAPGQTHTPTPTPRSGNMPFYDAEELQKLLTRLASDFLPDGPVAIGDSWDISFTEHKATVGTILHRQRHTLKELAENGAVAVIDVLGDCGMEKDKPAHSSETGERRVTVRKGRWSGEIRFDIPRGRVQSLALRHENDISSEMKGKENLTVELTMTEERVYRLKSMDELPAKPIVVKAAKPSATARTGTPAPATSRPATSQPWRRPYRFNPPATATQPTSTRPFARPGTDTLPLDRRSGKHPLTPGQAYPPPTTQRVKILTEPQRPASAPTPR